MKIEIYVPHITNNNYKHNMTKFRIIRKSRIEEKGYDACGDSIFECVDLDTNEKYVIKGEISQVRYVKNAVIPHSWWYVNDIHLATFYSNYRIDEDEVHYENNTTENKKLFEVLRAIFDFIEEKFSDFYCYYAHSN